VLAVYETVSTASARAMAGEGLTLTSISRENSRLPMADREGGKCRKERHDFQRYDAREYRVWPAVRQRLFAFSAEGKHKVPRLASATVRSTSKRGRQPAVQWCDPYRNSIATVAEMKR
jgi:Tfp pilus assembly protein PilW